MVDAAQELARRMLADYDARTPGQLFCEPLDLTTAPAYALQAEIARPAQQSKRFRSGRKLCFEERFAKQVVGTLMARGMARYLWLEQDGKCLVCGGNGDIPSVRAEPADEVDRAGITANRGISSNQPARPLILVVM